MVKLTEDMIVARTRVSDLSNVKKLNCWGADLDDVTVLRRLENVEMLSLSLNSIESLADFQHCKKLQELFLRKNNINSLRELLWLKDLGKLKNLWLAENPCSEENGCKYRQTVIHNLPQLEKLDNITISSQERAEALRYGDNVDNICPEEDAESFYDENRRMSIEELEDLRSEAGDEKHSISIMPDHQIIQSESLNRDTRCNELNSYQQRYHQDGYSADIMQMQLGSQSLQRAGSIGKLSTSSFYSRHEGSQQFQQLSYNNRDEQMNNNRTSLSSIGSRASFYHEDSRSTISEYPPMSFSRVQPQLQYPSQNHAGHGLSERRLGRQIQGQDSGRLGGIQRGRSRNSNILSSILCLIKEIDVPSLEVVEMAVRCRMEELDD